MTTQTFTVEQWRELHARLEAREVELADLRRAVREGEARRTLEAGDAKKAERYLAKREQRIQALETRVCELETELGANMDCNDELRRALRNANVACAQLRDQVNEKQAEIDKLANTPGNRSAREQELLVKWAHMQEELHREQQLTANMAMTLKKLNAAVIPESVRKRLEIRAQDAEALAADVYREELEAGAARGNAYYAQLLDDLSTTEVSSGTFQRTTAGDRGGHRALGPGKRS